MIKRVILLLAFLIPQLSFAAIADVSDSTSHAATQSDRTPTEPATVIENDLILAYCTIDIEDGTWTDPADFTEIDNIAAGANIPNHSYLGYKIRGSDAGSGYLFSYSGTASAIRCSLQAFRGQHITVPLDVTYVRATHRNENNQDAMVTAAQPITTVTNNDWVCLIQYGWDGSITPGMPSGYTEYMFANSANRTHVIACKAVAAAGVETPGVWTHSDVTSTSDSVNFTIAIAPLAVASTNSLLLLGPD